MKKEGANRREAARWLEQATLDLQAARDSAQRAHHEWACFQAQQAGEKALKAVLFFLGYRGVSSHALLELIDTAASERTELNALREEARLLDRHYMPTRYPNGLPGSEIPGRFYTEVDSKACVVSCGSILRAATSIVGGSGRS